MANYHIIPEKAWLQRHIRTSDRVNLAIPISLSYRGISLSIHLVIEVFQLFTRYFTLPVQFQLNSDFSYKFLNGKLTCRTIIQRASEADYQSCSIEISDIYTSDVLEHKWQASLKTILFLYE